ncbi:hypothetical protein GCM10022419_133010 [Nonomuraea rosea]|uniref:Uncharacterized protein n=1 Tax=Nonomuraea rosea TaxID=638574 RepID=A0ABP7A4J0_9ACTN
MRVLVRGPPNGTAPSPAGSTRPAAVITVPSVGPYAWTSRRSRAQARARPGGMSSEPTTIAPTPDRSAGSRTASSEGTTLADRTPVVSTRERSRAGSARSAALATTSVPPHARVTATSSTDASNANDANCSTGTPGPTSISGPNTETRFAREACSTATPFGRPVEPEV